MKASRKGICFIFVALVVCAVGCAGDGSTVTATFNQSAGLVGDLPANPLGWRVISSAIDPATGTMSTLYGNDLAVEYARTHSQHDFPAGAVLSLVTWTQAEDSRWFGAKIPSQAKSVEFLTVAAAPNGGSQYAYEAYTGNPLKRASAQQSGASPERVAYFLSIRASVMP